LLSLGRSRLRHQSPLFFGQPGQFFGQCRARGPDLFIKDETARQRQREPFPRGAILLLLRDY
jgi:hypothetical protein